MNEMVDEFEGVLAEIHDRKKVGHFCSRFRLRNHAALRLSRFSYVPAPPMLDWSLA